MRDTGASDDDAAVLSDLRHLQREGRSLYATLLKEDRLALIAAGLTFGAAQAPSSVGDSLNAVASWVERVNEVLADTPLQRDFRDTRARKRHSLSSDAAHAAKLLRDRLASLERVLAQLER